MRSSLLEFKKQDKKDMNIVTKPFTYQADTLDVPSESRSSPLPNLVPIEKMDETSTEAVKKLNQLVEKFNAGIFRFNEHKNDIENQLLLGMDLYPIHKEELDKAAKTREVASKKLEDLTSDETFMKGLAVWFAAAIGIAALAAAVAMPLLFLLFIPIPLFIGSYSYRKYQVHKATENYQAIHNKFNAFLSYPARINGFDSEMYKKDIAAFKCQFGDNFKAINDMEKTISELDIILFDRWNEALELQHNPA